jgi:signal transduction histidine kinase
VIEVKDDGCGIPNDEQEKLFTKFFRATNTKKIKAEGTGLGLYIVKKILDLTGGKIDFKSKENKGSTFAVKIPIK